MSAWLGKLALAAALLTGDAPVLAPEKKIEILTLQRDLNAAGREMAKLEAAYQAAEARARELNAKLGAALKAAEVDGFKFDGQSLEYKLEQKALEHKLDHKSLDYNPKGK